MLSFGLMPYLILIAMGPLVRSKRILLGGVAVLVLAELYAARTVFCAASSTAPIAAVVYPIVAAGRGGERSLDRFVPRHRQLATLSKRCCTRSS